MTSELIWALYNVISFKKNYEINMIIFQQYEDFNCAVTELIGHCFFGSEEDHKKWISDDIVQVLSAYDIGEDYEKFTHKAIQLFSMVFGNTDGKAIARTLSSWICDKCERLFSNISK